VAKYVEKRKFQRDGSADSSYLYVTPRTLLGIIRLAQAMAKLNFRSEVKQGDVDEAIRLMDYSIRSLRRHEGDKKTNRREQGSQGKEDRMTHMMQQVRKVCAKYNNRPLEVTELLN
jgi:DNA replication licensing factor MCM7